MNRFKKSGEFDRIRKELLAEFQHGVSETFAHDYTVVVDQC